MIISYQTIYAGSAYSRSIIGKNALSFAAINLPSGLSIDSETGVVSGTPTVTGRYAITILANGDGGVSAGVLDLTIVLNPAVQKPIITSTDEVTHETGTAFSHQITALSSTPVTAYYATGLPTGLSINQSTGLISGTPPIDAADVEKIIYIVKLEAENSYGTARQDLYLRLVQRPVITSSTAAWTYDRGDTITPYTVTGTKQAITFAASNLPSGLSINSTTGEITGTIVFPSIGESTITISASNNYLTGTAQIPITIYGAPIITSSLTPPTIILPTTVPRTTNYTYQITANAYPAPDRYLMSEFYLDTEDPTAVRALFAEDNGGGNPNSYTQHISLNGVDENFSYPWSLAHSDHPNFTITEVPNPGFLINSFVVSDFDSNYPYLSPLDGQYDFETLLFTPYPYCFYTLIWRKTSGNTDTVFHYYGLFRNRFFLNDPSNFNFNTSTGLLTFDTIGTSFPFQPENIPYKMWVKNSLGEGSANVIFTVQN